MPAAKRRGEDMDVDSSSSRKRHHTRRGPSDALPDASTKMPSVAQEAVLTPVPSTASSDSLVLETLRRITADLDSLRQTITCKICEKLYYEPYILSCGHTYCYRCLSTWFASARKPSCPDCRVRIRQNPAPAYSIKELVSIFTKRAELLPEGETLEDHEKWEKEEAAFVAAEKTNGAKGGLFSGMFDSTSAPASLQPWIDPETLLAHCPRCHWELEDGTCNQCALTFGSELGSNSTDDDTSDSEDSLNRALDQAERLDIEHDMDRSSVAGVYGTPAPAGQSFTEAETRVQRLRYERYRALQSHPLHRADPPSESPSHDSYDEATREYFDGAAIEISSDEDNDSVHHAHGGGREWIRRVVERSPTSDGRRSFSIFTGDSRTHPSRRSMFETTVVDYSRSSDDSEDRSDDDEDDVSDLIDDGGEESEEEDSEDDSEDGSEDSSEDDSHGSDSGSDSNASSLGDNHGATNTGRGGNIAQRVPSYSAQRIPPYSTARTRVPEGGARLARLPVSDTSSSSDEEPVVSSRSARSLARGDNGSSRHLTRRRIRV